MMEAKKKRKQRPALHDVAGLLTTNLADRSSSGGSNASSAPSSPKSSQSTPKSSTLPRSFSYRRASPREEDENEAPLDKSDDDDDVKFDYRRHQSSNYAVMKRSRSKKFTDTLRFYEQLSRLIPQYEDEDNLANPIHVEVEEKEDEEDQSDQQNRMNDGSKRKNGNFKSTLIWFENLARARRRQKDDEPKLRQRPISKKSKKNGKDKISQECDFQEKQYVDDEYSGGVSDGRSKSMEISRESPRLSGSDGKTSLSTSTSGGEGLRNSPTSSSRKNNNDHIQNNARCNCNNNNNNNHCKYKHKNIHHKRNNNNHNNNNNADCAELENEFVKDDPKKHFSAKYKLGKGSYGVVYVAKDKTDNRRVAIKVLNRGFQENRKSILNEIEMLRSCDHENVVAYRRSFLWRDKVWVVMEHCDGGCLRQLAAEGISEKKLAGIITKILRGLEYLHSMNRIHRDIKGDNILLDMNGNVKLADLGLCREVTDDMSGSQLAGSSFWMAPEMIRRKGYDCKADIWSVGATIVELLDGHPPYYRHGSFMAMYCTATRGAPSIESKKYTSGLKKFLLDCFTFDPCQRPSAAGLLNHPFLAKTANDEELAALFKSVFFVKAGVQFFGAAF